MLRKFLLACALIWAAPFAIAETPVGYEQDGRILFSFDMPDFWSLRSGGAQVLEGPNGEGARAVPRVIAIEPTAEEGAWMGFLSPRGVSNLDQAKDYLREIGAFLGGERQLNPPERRSIGGRQAEVISGTGQRNGRSHNFTIALIPIGQGRVAIVAGIVEAGVDPAYVDVINEVYASLRVGR